MLQREGVGKETRNKGTNGRDQAEDSEVGGVPNKSGYPRLIEEHREDQWLKCHARPEWKNKIRTVHSLPYLGSSEGRPEVPSPKTFPAVGDDFLIPSLKSLPGITPWDRTKSGALS